jgi:hypothetical protein
MALGQCKPFGLSLAPVCGSIFPDDILDVLGLVLSTFSIAGVWEMLLGRFPPGTALD